MQIFTSTKNWKYTEADRQAQEKLLKLQQQARASLPESFYGVRMLTHLPQVRKLPLYKLMKTIPKGVLHHIHYFCTDDYIFYRDHILTDPRIYLGKDLKTIEIGTKEQAEKNGWVSMQQGIAQYGHDKWLQMVVNLTYFNEQELKATNYQRSQIWKMFEQKIVTSLSIFVTADIFEKYTRHILKKYIANGYQRIEIRFGFQVLKIYNQQGKFQRNMQNKQFFQFYQKILDQVFDNQSERCFGWIQCGFKFHDEQFTQNKFRIMCESDWKLLVGFDFVNEQDAFPPLENYDPMVDKVLSQFPQLNRLKKAYHAGETVNNRINNVDVALKAGSVRIGHGLNILQRPELLPYCKNICVEKNPMSNLLLGYKKDLRESSAYFLLGLGIPVSISPDDPGKFGCQDTTQDYFISAVAYNWTLKHLKLIAYHSINHALCDDKIKEQLVKEFEKAWNKWIAGFLEVDSKEQSGIFTNSFINENDIFNSYFNWSFTSQEQLAEKKLIIEQEKLVEVIPEETYHLKSNKFSSLLSLINNSSLFKELQALPKSVLHSCHLHYSHDINFVKQCNLKFEDFWQTETQEIVYGQRQKQEWVQLKRQNLYELISLSDLQIDQIQNQRDFWTILNKKKRNMLTLLKKGSIFDSYLRHVLQKLSKQGYQRIQFRVEPFQISEQKGLKNYFKLVEDVIKDVTASKPSFSIGLIVTVSKEKSSEEIISFFKQVCSINSPLVVGFDFEHEQSEDSYPPIEHFDSLLNEVLVDFSDCHVQKLYQAGASSDHRNNNIRSALALGANRISNGTNILQFSQMVPHCRQLCFETNPVFQFISRISGKEDVRLSYGTVLQGLKVPVSIGSAYSGLLGVSSTSLDLALTLVGSNWSLRNLKLSFLHSIDYSAATPGQKINIRKQFLSAWQKWISNYTN